MKHKEKIEFIFNLYDEIETISDSELNSKLIILQSLVNDRSTEIRSWIGKILINIPTKESQDILFKYLDDKNELVRCEAVDSIRVFIDKEIFLKLKDMAIEDRSFLVRGYAVYGFVEIGKKLGEKNLDKFILENIIPNENNSFVKLNCYEALYNLGNKNFLNNIFSLFRSKNYRIRCAIISTLDEILNDENRSMIKEFIDSINISEEPFSVESSIIKLSKRLEL